MGGEDVLACSGEVDGLDELHRLDSVRPGMAGLPATQPPCGLDAGQRPEVFYAALPCRSCLPCCSPRREGNKAGIKLPTIRLDSG